MSTLESNPLTAFHWEPQPEAESLVNEIVEEFISREPGFAQSFRARLLGEAGVRFVDLIDYIAVPDSNAMRGRLSEAGYIPGPDDSGVACFTQQNGIFPTIALVDRETTQIAIKVEDVIDFLATWGMTSAKIEGEPLSPMRRVQIAGGLFAVERHGYRGLELPVWSAQKSALVLKHLESFRVRVRDGDDEAAFAAANELIDAAIADLGVDYTCDLYFRAEREYWQRRNRAARAQKARQDRLGIGWSNHDHHTYRSSRKNFAKLIAIHEKLGLVCRERFYAGKEAGWGAQVMEQPVSGIITFNDVDLSPEELMGDFSHEGLAPRDKLGTVGLWCALHGEAMLQAGMHHLECQFSFDALREQLEKEEGVKCMKPFTNFAYLRQQFTEGERWKVRDARINDALSAGYISAEQAQQFREQGAIGSHLENLERNQGFKGFNQTGVSEIIAATDPRKQLVAG